ncbi:MAG: hypothetical protein JWM16_5699 [Verrucomicrobiales bacterium]|nr:hypothetical protein [Verrucomicrobiales bacterium]
MSAGFRSVTGRAYQFSASERKVARAALVLFTSLSASSEFYSFADAVERILGRITVTAGGRDRPEV